MNEYQLDIITDASGVPALVDSRTFTARGPRRAARKARRLTRANVSDRRTQYGEMYHKPLTGGYSAVYVATIEI